MVTETVEQFSNEGIESLIVDAGLFDVTLTGAQQDTVVVEVRMPRQLQKHFQIQHSQKGSLLKVELVQNKIGLMGFHGELRIVFQVPKQTNVEVNTSSGEQEIRAIDSQNVVIAASSGDITASEINAEIAAASSSGKVKLEKIVGSINVRTSSGDIELRNTEGDLTLQAASGKTIVQGSTGNIFAHSSSGDHDFEQITGDIQAQTSSGSITATECEGRLDLKSASGDLIGRSISVRDRADLVTSSGEIQFQFTNPAADLSFDLASSSGKLTVSGTQSEEKLTSGSGPVKIAGRSSSGDQSYE